MYYPNGIIAHNSRIESMPPFGILDALLYVYKMSLTS